MTRRIQITLLSLLMSVCAMASETSVKNSDGVYIWYIFNSSTKTASVTYKGSSSTSYKNEYTGEVVIPSSVTYKGEEYSVTSIGNYAFKSCTALTSITIPEGVTSIGDYAFRNCSALTSITLPEGLTSIGKYAFYNCDALTSITLPEGVTSIESFAFQDCSALTSITLPESLTSIGNFAFNDCDALTSVTIPEGVTSIGNQAFAYCDALTSITIPESVTEIGSVAFFACRGLISVEFNAKNCTSMGSVSSPVFSGCTKLTNLTIGENVTNIPSYAFYKCSGLTSVTLPESVTEIGYEAFRDCDALTSITIPEGVTSIREWAFADCSSLTSITIPEGVTRIGSNAFNGCSSLTSIVVALDNNSYTSIDGVLFSKDHTILINYPEGKKDVTSYAIPESVIKIGDYAFYNCSGLTSITIPKGVTEIGNSAFRGCGSLTSITLPEGVTKIRDSAFYDCSSLTSITLPEGVTEIGDQAFSGCSSLTSITSMNVTPPSIGNSYTFGEVDKSIPVYVPMQSVEAYKSAEYWRDFTNIVGKFLVVTATAENGTVIGAGVYEENAEVTLMATPDEGYTFVKWSDGVTDSPRTVEVTSDLTLTAVFELKEYTLTTEAENGTVEGAGTYKHGAEATLTVTPAEGYKFVQWSDGVTDNPRTIEVTSDLTLTAEFKIDVTPISDIQTSDVKVRLIGNEIAVEGTDDYAVYSISGQNLGKAESVERGIYIVVANGKCCKVIAK